MQAATDKVAQIVAVEAMDRTEAAAQRAASKDSSQQTKKKDKKKDDKKDNKAALPNVDKDNSGKNFVGYTAASIAHYIM